ncbi:hypothetical protein SDRG_13702 [Saprolegnia diclina VS20]|uniref:Uncharacterized protein n=1 Tax=Saprolegnia diclina (strain VS20) TaxID=1156394 RepID=T0R910_SAPDV|nr:hypothetical protein SDRG_13702 [Saprolegnia diclina VS20]EQC28623.1 hypothetical protein SDRG_13702 [Saprolegnia diclina VS20]|eukprot:XP_008618020.1 hypothetical protein SDRG_13702 [Saprolegnia diclina VS20]
MRRVESHAVVPTVGVALPLKSRSAGVAERRKPLHRFVVTDAPEDPELLFSPRNAEEPTSTNVDVPRRILDTGRTRPGKMEQKGRFTIIDLVPTSPASELPSAMIRNLVQLQSEAIDIA